MQFSIPMKPLSVNMAWKGKRFKSAAYSNFEEEFFLVAPRGLVAIVGPVEMRVVWNLKNARASDIDNALKTLLDCLVKCGILIDDRHIWRLVVEKKQSAVDSIDVEISPLQIR